MTEKDYIADAMRLGATIERGINWIWADGFPTESAAAQFIRNHPTMETRGIYPDKNGTYSVRFR